MFEATASPPIARIRALATTTASSGRDTFNVIMSFASLKLGQSNNVFHTLSGARGILSTAIYAQTSLCQQKLAQLLSLDPVKHDRGRFRVGIDPDVPPDHVSLPPPYKSWINGLVDGVGGLHTIAPGQPHDTAVCDHLQPGDFLAPGRGRPGLHPKTGSERRRHHHHGGRG